LPALRSLAAEATKAFLNIICYSRRAITRQRHQPLALVFAGHKMHEISPLLDSLWGYPEVAVALLLPDDTIRGWRKLFEPCLSG
jgi:hypothetical protein